MGKFAGFLGALHWFSVSLGRVQELKSVVKINAAEAAW